MPDEELKPFPFCGGEPKFNGSPEFTFGVAIICSNCSGKRFFTVEGATEACNRRVESLDTPPRGGVDVGVNPRQINGAEPQAEIYRCRECGAVMNEGEGRTFTVCSECWGKR